MFKSTWIPDTNPLCFAHCECINTTHHNLFTPWLSVVLALLVLPDFCHMHAWHVQWIDMLFSRRSCVSPSNCTVTTQTPSMKNAVTGARKNLHGRLHTLLSRVRTRLRSHGNVTPPCTSLHRQWRRYMDQSGNRQTAPVNKPIEHPKQCVNFTLGPDGVSENDSVPFC